MGAANQLINAEAASDKATKVSGVWERLFEDEATGIETESEKARLAVNKQQPSNIQRNPNRTYSQAFTPTFPTS